LFSLSFAEPADENKGLLTEFVDIADKTIHVKNKENEADKTKEGKPESWAPWDEKMKSHQINKLQKGKYQIRDQKVETPKVTQYILKFRGQKS